MTPPESLRVLKMLAQSQPLENYTLGAMIVGRWPTGQPGITFKTIGPTLNIPPDDLEESLLILKAFIGKYGRVHNLEYFGAFIGRLADGTIDIQPIIEDKEGDPSFILTGESE